MFNPEFDSGPTFAFLVRAIDSPGDPEAVEMAERAIATLPPLWMAGRKSTRGRRG